MTTLKELEKRVEQLEKNKAGDRPLYDELNTIFDFTGSCNEYQYDDCNEAVYVKHDSGFDSDEITRFVKFMKDEDNGDWKIEIHDDEIQINIDI